MAMSNEQLTAAVLDLQNTVQGINVQLGDLVPKMQQPIIETNALGTTLDAKLMQAVNPLIDADLITVVQKISNAQDNLRLMTIDCDKGWWRSRGGWEVTKLRRVNAQMT